MYLRLLLILAALAVGGVSLSGAVPSPSRKAFNPPSQSPGATLFHRMAPESTGLVVNNAYDDSRMWTSRYRAFMGGGMGSGVAAGDYDGDGQVDLYVSTKTRPGRLFRNQGNWKFIDVTETAGVVEEGALLGWLKGTVKSQDAVIWRQGATFVDINNDALPDLYICRNNAPNLLYINQGDGTFKEEAQKRGLAVVDGSVMGAFADYDGDGALDVFILTNQVDGTEAAGRPDRLFRNVGKGYFAEVTASSGIAGPTFGHAAVWFDYNGDRWPDIYVANDFSGPDHLYRNNRDGTFTNVMREVAPHTPYSSMGADTGDINNDGQIDLLVADMATTTREKDRRGLVASRNDVLQNAAEPTAPQYMRNALLLNHGNGLFGEAACWAGIDATDWTWSVRFEDFDNDGWTDLHVTNGMVREANNSDLLAAMMRALSDAQRISTIKKAPPLMESNLAFRNREGQGFESVSKAWGLDELSVSFGAATADFDNDGDLDLAYLNYDGGLSVFRNDVAGRNRIQVRLRGTQSNHFGVGAVVRVDGSSGQQTQMMTVARGYTSGSELVAHFGLGPDGQAKRVVVEWPSGATQVFENVDANHAYLITEQASGSAATQAPPPPLFQARAKEVGLALNDASQFALPDKEQIFIPFRTDRRGPGLAVGDIDGDGRDDVFVAATTGSAARMLRWRGKAFVEDVPQGVPATKVEDGPPLFFDADGDGTTDLLITKASALSSAWPDSFHPILYANDGTGRFKATDWLPRLPLNAGAVCAADIDGDGDLDLFLGARSVPGRYPEKPRSFLLRNDGGRFNEIEGDGSALATVGLVTSALFRDVDQDGRPDLIIASEWDHVRYFHNDGSSRFSDWTERSGFISGGRGWWNSLAEADLNGDGRPDFAAGNLGLNTTYKASREKPAVLFYGDFAQNGTRLVIEAAYDGDRLSPLRSRADLGARLPFILRRYPKNNDFARASMAEIFDARPLAEAGRLVADNYSSGVFLSQPDGSYRFGALPPSAQIGPINGLVAADLDGDGIADLAAVQNSDAAVPHFDGGVGIFLRGKGDGCFEALSPERSGVIAQGSGRALVLLANGESVRPNLFFTRHGEAAEFLAHQSPLPWLHIQLKGNRGNPHGVGARVRIVFRSRPPVYHEMGLGGGWLSQSAPSCYLAAPTGELPSEATVTWPDGQVSHHAAPAAPGRWTLQR